jgi:hypothetical protein
VLAYPESSLTAKTDSWAPVVHRPWFAGARKPKTNERGRQHSEEQNSRETMGCTNYATENTAPLRLRGAGTVLV